MHDAVVEAWLAAAEKRPDAGALLDTAEMLYRRQADLSPQSIVSNLLLARLHEQNGDLQRALVALRREPFHWRPDQMFLRATTLREHGRVAALAGERDEAISYYSKYLALRVDPEPAVKPHVDGVRRELERLLARGR